MSEQLEQDTEASPFDVGDEVSLGVGSSTYMGAYKEVPVDSIRPNEWNPNEMDADMFNALAGDVAQHFLQPILVARDPEGVNDYIIVDGYHRWEAMCLQGSLNIGVIEVPADMAEDLDQLKVRTVRMNKVRGSTNQKKMMALVTDLAERRTVEELADLLVFSDVDKLQEMVNRGRGMLPAGKARDHFDKVKDEIKTVEDLTTVLQKLFAEYGDTLAAHYMILDYGGKKHVWIRLQSTAQYQHLKELADATRSMGYTFESVVNAVIGRMTPETLRALEAGGLLTPIEEGGIDGFFTEDITG